MTETKNKQIMKREQRFIKVITRKMTKAGFECKMKDGRFIMIKDGKPFEIEMWETPGWGRRRVHFNLSFALEEMSNVKSEALMWLATESNNHSDYTVTRLSSDHFSCSVETTVRSAKEFAREFGFAYKQIGITCKNLIANYDRIKDEFRVPPVHRPIGYLADRYMEEEKKLNERKLVAQTYSTFADETNKNENQQN